MQMKNLVRCLVFVAAPLAGLSLGAQTTPPPPTEPLPTEEKEEIVVLSPFSVETSRDVGYEASASLAGTGLSTKITDLGSSVSVMTMKFLEDTGSTKLGDALLYQNSMEVTGFGGNLSGATPAQGGITAEPTLSNAAVGTRVRGLAEATMARNFFRAIIPSDGYNTDRVEVNRGANALLFGVGSPAGIINTTTSSAVVNKTSGSLDLSTGSYGSWRAAANYNQVILQNQLAVRVAAVKNDDKYQQKFAFANTERQYATATWDIKPLRNLGIFDSTTVRAGYENGKITSNKPRTLTPSDRISSWFDATLPQNLKDLGAVGKVSYDPTNGPFNTFTAAAHTATIGVVDQVNRSPVFIFQDVNATSPLDNSMLVNPGTTPPVLGRVAVSGNTYFPSTNKVGTAVTAYSRELSRVRLDYALPDQQYYLGENMTDPTLFNFFDNLLVGPNSKAVSHLKSLDASLEQLLFNRTAGVELSFNRQNWDEKFRSLLSESAPYISIDVNTKLWTGEPNLNYGRPFISTSGTARYNEQQIETSKVKLFYSLDLEKILGNRTGKILGKHVFALLGQKEKLDTELHTGGTPFYTRDPWANGGGNQSRLAPQGKQIVTWIYLGPSLKDATTPQGINLQGLQQNLLNFQDTIGNGVVMSRVPPIIPTTIPPATPAQVLAIASLPQYAARGESIQVLREDDRVSNTASAASKSKRTLDSKAFSTQSNWLSDQIVTTVGWRKEDAHTLRANAPIQSPELYAQVNDTDFVNLTNPATGPLITRSQDFSKTLFAWSAVAKAPKSWLKPVPFISAFNLYTGSSENFDPPDTKVTNVFGADLAPPSGKTKESGLYFEVLDGRISVRLNFFETTQNGSFNQTLNGLGASILSAHKSVYDISHNGFTGAPVAGASGYPNSYYAPPQALLDLYSWKTAGATGSYVDPGVRDTSDFVTKGKELEVSYKATRGLSFIFNVSEQESVRTNTGADTYKLLFNTPTVSSTGAAGAPLAVEWLNPWALQIPLNQGAIGKEGTSDRNLLANNFQTFTLNPFNTARAADGSVATELRKWRANLVSNYEFREGTLKGFGAGMGVRWLDKAAIGYPVITVESDLSPSDGVAELSDIRVSDTRHPYYSPSETMYDAWISYGTKVFKKKYDLKVQLNVRDLFTHNKLVPVGANPDGSIALWSIAEGRKFTLSTKLSF